MKTKSKFEEALEQLTQLRVELLKVGNESTEEKISEIEMTICEGIDLLNNVGLADVRQQRELLPIDFVMWYSGMEKQKIVNAIKRWMKERQ